MEHFVIFAVVGLAFGAAYVGRQRALLLSAILFALVLELCQLLLATRHARLEDFVVDAAAACLGIFTARVVRGLVVAQYR
ncbi:VanZ family protein [Bradyrhizobium symbiodeficiens]|uniref:VanZ family protein n=1 Tax=Bradyrhizobium symbiodeficiens TaxID=1404367 RepID=UPI003BB14478